jgi:hypothetical protein
MRKIMITIILILATMKLSAPVNEAEGYIINNEPIYAYNVSDPFLRAVIAFESNLDERAVNPYTKARGILQIMPVMIREVNKYSDVRYTWDDAWNPVKSIEIWNIIMTVKNPEYYPDRAIRIWFGVGVQYDGMTWEDYYQEVMKVL